MTVNIVVTDGFTLNPGDLTWDSLAELGRLKVYDHTAPDKLIERSCEAELLLVNKTMLGRSELEQLPRLRYIGVLATGYNVVDLEAAAAHGVVVTNIPAYGPASVAQFVFALLLSMVQPISYYRREVKQGRWAQSRDFCFYDHSMPELSQMTLGIIGFGAIGRKVAKIAQGFDMTVVVASRSCPRELPSGIDCVSQQQLLERSDVISMHCPLTDDTRGMIDRVFLERMKPTAYLINTARGPLVNEVDLERALNERQIAGAALDVLSVEPPSSGHPLVALDNCTVTPHIAWSTHAARSRLMDIAAANVAGFLGGRLQNVVS